MHYRYIELPPNAKIGKGKTKPLFDINEMLAKDKTLKHRISIEVPQRKINSFLDNPDGTKWWVGDLVAHQVWYQTEKKRGAH